jgi:hypothetical protein
LFLVTIITSVHSLLLQSKSIRNCKTQGHDIDLHVYTAKVPGVSKRSGMVLIISWTGVSNLEFYWYHLVCGKLDEVVTTLSNSINKDIIMLSCDLWPIYMFINYSGIFVNSDLSRRHFLACTSAWVDLKRGLFELWHNTDDVKIECLMHMLCHAVLMYCNTRPCIITKEHTRNVYLLEACKYFVLLGGDITDYIIQHLYTFDPVYSGLYRLVWCWLTSAVTNT